MLEAESLNPQHIYIIDTVEDEYLHQYLRRHADKVAHFSSLENAVIEARKDAVIIVFINARLIDSSNFSAFYSHKNKLETAVFILLTDGKNTLDSQIPVEDFDFILDVQFMKFHTETLLRLAKRNSEMLRENQRFYNMLIQNNTVLENRIAQVPVGILVTDDQFNIEYANKCFYEWTSQPFGTLEFKSISAFFDEGLKISYLLKKSLENASTEVADNLKVIGKDKEVNVTATIVDISESDDEKKYQWILQKNADLSKNTSGFKDRISLVQNLATVLAHEIFNPVNIISGRIQLLQQQIQDETVQEKLDVLAEQVDRISVIIQILRQFNQHSATLITDDFAIDTILTKQLKSYPDIFVFNKSDNKNLSKVNIRGNRLQITEAFNSLLLILSRLTVESEKIYVKSQKIKNAGHLKHSAIRFICPYTENFLDFYNSFNEFKLGSNFKYSTLEVVLFRSLFEGNNIESFITIEENSAIVVNTIFVNI